MSIKDNQIQKNSEMNNLDQLKPKLKATVMAKEF